MTNKERFHHLPPYPTPKTKKKCNYIQPVSCNLSARLYITKSFQIGPNRRSPPMANVRAHPVRSTAKILKPMLDRTTSASDMQLRN